MTLLFVLCKCENNFFIANTPKRALFMQFDRKTANFRAITVQNGTGQNG
jgi:hypothetical protein